jgi:hypothetical protein
MLEHIKKLSELNIQKGDIFDYYEDVNGVKYKKICIGFVLGKTITYQGNLEVLYSKTYIDKPTKAIVYNTKKQAKRECEKLGYEYIRPYFYSQICT